MAKRKKTAQRKQRQKLSLGRTLGLILAIEGIALSLKAYDDRQTTLAHLKTQTHREALAVSEYMSGKAATVQQTLKVAALSARSPSQTVSYHPDIRTATSLTNALSAAKGSQLAKAGEAASGLMARQETLGLLGKDQFIVAERVGSSSVYIALVDVSAWLPQASGQRSFSLAPVKLDGPRKAESGVVSACSPLNQSSVSVCIQTARPVFTLSDLIPLIIYGLLLLGPALAILGLMQLLRQGKVETETFEGEASKAGRVLKAVLHETKSGFWSWDQDSDRVWLSAEAGFLIGNLGAGHYRWSDLEAYINTDHVAAVRQAIKTLPERGYISQVFASPDRNTWLDLRARPDENDNQLNGVLMDVTDIRAAMARSRQAEARLKSALEGFAGPFALWDQRKRLIYWNHAFTRVFGLEETVRTGMGYDTAMLAQASNIVERRAANTDDGGEIIRTRSDIWYKIVERSTATGGLITIGLDVSADVTYEVKLREKQKELQKLVISLEQSEGYAGELARKLNEEKLKAEHTANTKSAFLANMSHELRTPLNAINGFSEILHEEIYGPLGDERYKGYARDILSSGQHLLDLINDILDMAKIEAGKMTVDLRPIDLIEPVDAAVRMIRRKAEDKGITLRLSAPDSLPRIEADHRAIKQMILNLVSNAIKFTDDGGAILVSIDRKGNELRVSVRDNGVGIPAEALPRLAQPFEQVGETRSRNAEGTGLGLALTKSFAEMHGGRLEIASQEGKGTMVCFYVPIPERTTKPGTIEAA